MILHLNFPVFFCYLYATWHLLFPATLMLFHSMLFFLWLFLLQYYKYSHPSYHSFKSWLSAHTYAKLVGTIHCLTSSCVFSKMAVNFFCYSSFGRISQSFASSFIILHSLLACEIFQAWTCTSFTFYAAPVVLTEWDLSLVGMLLLVISSSLKLSYTLTLES